MTWFGINYYRKSNTKIGVEIGSHPKELQYNVPDLRDNGSMCTWILTTTMSTPPSPPLRAFPRGTWVTLELQIQMSNQRIRTGVPEDAICEVPSENMQEVFGTDACIESGSSLRILSRVGSQTSPNPGEGVLQGATSELRRWRLDSFSSPSRWYPSSYICRNRYHLCSR